MTQGQAKTIIGLLIMLLISIVTMLGVLMSSALPKMERAVLVAEEIEPKVERAVQVTERLEARVQELTDEIQPVLVAGALKAVESITEIDASQIGQRATQETEGVVGAAADRLREAIDRRRESSATNDDD